jgi:hypothetical protein
MQNALASPPFGCHAPILDQNPSPPYLKPEWEIVAVFVPQFKTFA